MLPVLTYVHSRIVHFSLGVTHLVDLYPKMFVFLCYILFGMNAFKEHNNFINR